MNEKAKVRLGNDTDQAMINIPIVSYDDEGIPLYNSSVLVM